MAENGSSDAADWELRPGGMFVQKRGDGSAPSGPMVNVKVSHGSDHYEISVPAQSTFGELKRLLSPEVGLEPHEQRLLFRGREKDNDECLHMVGVKDMSKVVLVEDKASGERKLEGKHEELKKNEGVVKACEAIARVSVEVDKLAEKVSGLESAVYAGNKLEEKEFLVLTELLMVQLLNLDGIEAEGEAKVRRKTEVRRIQSYVETLDVLKSRKSKPFNSSNDVLVTTQWEAFD